MTYEQKTQFKAISLDTNTWIYGYYIYNEILNSGYITSFITEPTYNIGEFNIVSQTKLININTLCLSIGLNDKNNNPIYSNDILKMNDKVFRIYHTFGGFVFKTFYWAEKDGTADLVSGDELITEEISNPQNAAYIRDNSEIMSNHFDHLLLTK
jgi:hypothetical protein